MGQNSQPTLGSAVAFIVTALIASILLISAFIFWLGEVIGSHLLAMVLVGGVCAVVSILIYRISLRPMIQEISHQISTIYEVSASAKRLLDWILNSAISWIDKIIR
ncbi:MAG: hypothetical protein SNH01_08235 [Rikenellaceae bacterium]